MRGTSLAAAACVVAACTGGGAVAGSGARQRHRRPARGDARPRPAPGGAGAPGPSSTRTRSGPVSPRACRRPGSSPSPGPRPLDGAVYGQPLVVGGDVIAATENDSVYAISRATGKTVWRAHVGTPVPQSALHGCGDIFPLGITGTPDLRPGRRARLRGGGDDRVPARAVRAVGGRRQGRGQDATSTSRPRRTSPPRTSSARPSRSTTGGSTPRSAGWRATAAPTSAASSGSTSTARARW